MMSEKKKWIPCFFKASDREKGSWCFMCEKKIKMGKMVFYFPKVKANALGKKGTAYCFDCFGKKVKELCVIELI